MIALENAGLLQGELRSPLDNIFFLPINGCAASDFMVVLTFQLTEMTNFSNCYYCCYC